MDTKPDNSWNLECWSECWKAVTSFVQEEQDEKKLADAWDKRWDKRHERPPGDFEDDHIKRSTIETIDFLKDFGFDPKGKKILDIGCGPGVLTLPLARMGAEVTALDISPGVLERLSKTAKEEGFSVSTSAVSWWSADIDKLGFRGKYDLVIASRTPSINDADTLEKMMACSKDLCYYSSFLNVGEDKAFMDIQKMISGEDNSGRKMRNHHGAYTMIFPFMYLYFSGYSPDIRINRPGQREEECDKASERAIKFFGHGRFLDDEVKENIRDYYRNASENGIYKPKSSGCHGMMIWRTKKV